MAENMYWIAFNCADGTNKAYIVQSVRCIDGQFSTVQVLEFFRYSYEDNKTTQTNPKKKMFI